MTRSFLTPDDLSTEELKEVIDLAVRSKKKADTLDGQLAGKQIALLFEKPSTRTRVSFEAAVASMGGHPIVLRGDELHLGRGETIEDTGRVLSRYVDAIVLRTSGHDRLERLADAASVPVINALSDLLHPCQALADFQTIEEKVGRLSGVRLAFIGDGNNVAHSLMIAGAMLGIDVAVATPKGYEPYPELTERASRIAGFNECQLTVTNVVAEAAFGADVLYTDVWTSMGQEDEQEARREKFKPYSITSELVDMAADDVIVMHCLPAHRGEEIAAEVIDGPRSVVWDQAENRLHSQRALLAWLLD